jgi:hypothetical protein
MLSYIILLNCVLLNGQSQINRKVVDAATGENMSFVSIYVPTNNSKSTISNINGDFSVNGLVDADTVIFSYVGYETRT